MTDLEKNDYYIRAMLLEYSELRQEKRVSLQQLAAMPTILVSAIGIMLTICFGLHANENPIYNQNELIAFICYAIIPGITAFIGVLWLDQAYRRVRLSVYLALIEKKISGAVKTSVIEEKITNAVGTDKIDEIDVEDPMFWEQWTHIQSNYKTFFKRVIHYRYYVSLGLFLFLPLLSFFLGFVLIGHELSDLIVYVRCFNLTPIPISFTVGIVFYILFLIFGSMYIFSRYKTVKSFEMLFKIPQAKHRDSSRKCWKQAEG